MLEYCLSSFRWMEKLSDNSWCNTWISTGQKLFIVCNEQVHIKETLKIVFVLEIADIKIEARSTGNYKDYQAIEILSLFSYHVHLNFCSIHSVKYCTESVTLLGATDNLYNILFLQPERSSKFWVTRAVNYCIFLLAIQVSVGFEKVKIMFPISITTNWSNGLL